MLREPNLCWICKQLVLVSGWQALTPVVVSCSDLDTHSGMFTFLSYRDPNLLKTADVYDGTADFLRKLDLDQDALTKVCGPTCWVILSMEDMVLGIQMHWCSELSCLHAVTMGNAGGWPGCALPMQPVFYMRTLFSSRCPTH